MLPVLSAVELGWVVGKTAGDIYKIILITIVLTVIYSGY